MSGKWSYMLDLSNKIVMMSQISHFELFVTKIIICYKKYSFCFKFEMETKRVRLAPEHYSSKWNSQVKCHPSCVPSILNTISPLPIRIIRYKHNYLWQENSILIWVELSRGVAPEHHHTAEEPREVQSIHALSPFDAEIDFPCTHRIICYKHNYLLQEIQR